MASYVSAQHESNPVLWLTTPLGEVEVHVSCLLRTTFKSLIINPLLAMLVFDIGEFMDVDSLSINMQRKELGKYSAILTSRLVNNPYIFHGCDMDLGIFQCHTL